MTRAITTLALLLFVFETAASSPRARGQRITLAGVEYTRLDDWAQSHRFQFRWVTPRRDVRVSSNSSSLACTIDSRRCELNSITVWLSHPIALHAGAAWIASADLATAIHPVLFPGRNASGQKIKTICLDPGHGGRDPGHRAGRQQEKTYTLLLARELSAQLSKAGFNVTLTRSSDTFVDLPARPDTARRRKADLLLSLHFNAIGTGGSSVQGAEVYCLTPARASSTNARGEGAGTGAFPGNRLDSKNMLLAYEVQRSLVKRLAVEDRGVKRARFAVLRTAEMPTVLIEGGFMSHAGEAKKIFSAAYRRQMAAAIVEAVQSYKRTVEN